ncbi:carbohydrate porin [Gluconacetobacter sp. Hr-1-5]|uniref:carbohydrate porin n=1 Tax=Gluconacetobacter sp. Hr-1-5 TaxID=3395370 RepID=UPI003B522DF8
MRHICPFLVLFAIAQAPCDAVAQDAGSVSTTDRAGVQPSLRFNQPGSSSIDDPGSFFSAPYGDSHFFGDWQGMQPWLRNRGIHVAADVHEELAGNFRGGRRQGVTNAGQVGVEVDIDWTKFIGLPNFWTHTMIVNGHGRSLSSQYIGNVAAVQQIYGSRGNVVAHLVYMYGESAFFHNRVDISAGWLPVGSFFASTILECNFMNVSICGNPAPSKYTQSDLDWPSGNLGVVLRIRPTLRTYVTGGLFAVSPHAYSGGISGWSWAQDGLGKLTTPVEVGWTPEFGKDRLLGHYKAGYGYDNSHYNDLYEDIHGDPWVATGLPARKQSGRSSAWIIANQMVMRNGPGATNGLILLGGYMYTSGHTTAMNHHLWAGAIETGASWGRPLDTIGISYGWLQMSRSATLQQEASQALGLPFQSNPWGPVYGVQTHENVYEAFYNINVVNCVSLQPDFQFIQRPGATSTIHDAAVMALQFNIVL